MSKYQKAREPQRVEQNRKRILAISLVTIGALLVFFLLILPNLKPPDTSVINQITPASQAVPANKTSMGNSAAPVKLDVWEDFQCSGCLFYTKNLEPRIVQAYVETGKVYYTFHFYPFIDGGQGESHDAANAAACASAQGHFWDYHDMLFANWIGENAGSFTQPRLIAFAQTVGLETTAFKQCFQTTANSAQIQQDIAAGTKLGVPPTPGIFVNGQMVVSSAGKNYIPSIEDISRAIDTAINGQ